MRRAHVPEHGRGSLRTVGIQAPQDVPLDIRFSSDGPNGCKSGLIVPLAEWPEGCGFSRLLR